MILLSNIKAVTEYGKIVILHDDGTWSYIPETTPQNDLLQILQIIFEKLTTPSENNLKEMNYKVELIKPGSMYTFMLKGGKSVVVVDSLSFKVGSAQCRSSIIGKEDEILDAIQQIFLRKEPPELGTAAGIELLKMQIKDAVNQITGFSKVNEQFGVTNVYLYIKAVSSVE